MLTVHRCRPKIWEIRIFFLKKVFFLLLVFLKLTLVLLKRMGHYDKWFHYFILPTFAMKYDPHRLLCIMCNGYCHAMFVLEKNYLQKFSTFSLSAVSFLFIFVLLICTRKLEGLHSKLTLRISLPQMVKDSSLLLKL